MRAIEKGWKGPPFDPFELAKLLRIDIRVNEQVTDARTIARGADRFLIEYNPAKSIPRIRYSICHEIAHTLFPDCRECIRNRSSRHEQADDAWQLEMLRNIGASELLMPIGSFRGLVENHSSLDELLRARQRFGVSLEAILLRFARVTTKRCAVFTARIGSSRVVLEYAVPSRTYDARFHTLFPLPTDSIVAQTAKARHAVARTERWGRYGLLHVQSVGLPPHKSDITGRAAGIVFPSKAEGSDIGGIQFVSGDATDPQGEGQHLVIQVVNDKSPFWGAGFARSVRTRWPDVQRQFSGWAMRYKSEFHLGNVHFIQADKRTSVASMIAQHGFGPATTPRIRYAALAKCLAGVAVYARNKRADLHMPRIGCGQAGGHWPIVEELIRKHLESAGVRIFIYDLPGNSFKEIDYPAIF